MLEATRLNDVEEMRDSKDGFTYVVRLCSRVTPGNGAVEMAAFAVRQSLSYYDACWNIA